MTSPTSGRAEHNLGYARLLTGDLVGRPAGDGLGRPVLAPLSRRQPGVGEQDRAEVLTGGRRAREAIAALESAATAYGDPRSAELPGRVRADAGPRPCSARTRPGARVVARRAARRFRTQGSEVPGPASRRGRDGRGDRRGEPVAAALLARARRAGRRPAGQHARAATPRSSSSRPRGSPPARGELDDARGPDRQGPRRRGLARRHAAALAGGAVRARRDRGRPSDRPPSTSAPGCSDLHAWQSSFGSLDLQSTLVGHGRALALQGLRLGRSRTGARSSSYEWSERARALVGRVAPVRPPHDERWPPTSPSCGCCTPPTRAPRSAERPPAGPSCATRSGSGSWYGEGGGRVGEPAGARGAAGRAGRPPTPPRGARRGRRTGSPRSWSPADAAHGIRLCERDAPSTPDLDADRRRPGHGGLRPGGTLRGRDPGLAGRAARGRSRPARRPRCCRGSATGGWC